MPEKSLPPPVGLSMIFDFLISLSEKGTSREARARPLRGLSGCPAIPPEYPAQKIYAKKPCEKRTVFVASAVFSAICLSGFCPSPVPGKIVRLFRVIFYVFALVPPLPLSFLNLFVVKGHLIPSVSLRSTPPLTSPFRYIFSEKKCNENLRKDLYRTDTGDTPCG